MLANICSSQDDFSLTEKLLIEFVHSILIESRLDVDRYRNSEILIDMFKESNQDHLEQTVDVQAIIYRTIFDIFLTYGKYISTLTRYITTEQQAYFFHKLYLSNFRNPQKRLN